MTIFTKNYDSDILRDIEQGADAYIKKFIRKQPLTAVENAALNEFMEAVVQSVDKETHYAIFALMLASDQRNALDGLRGALAPEPDELPYMDENEEHRTYWGKL